ncbi:hypothetical protein [Natronobacterium lacisalsi]|nr:hypothetical protein [Halobiforma lacisalsi]
MASPVLEDRSAKEPGDDYPLEGASFAAGDHGASGCPTTASERNAFY